MPRSDDALLDTVIGYRRGNWAYEWSQQAMLWQRKALEFESGEKPVKLAACRKSVQYCGISPFKRG